MSMSSWKMVMLSFSETMVYFKGFTVIIQLSFLVHTIIYWYDNDMNLSIDADLYISTSKRTPANEAYF